MTDIPSDRDPVLLELEACNQTIKEMRAEMSELRDLLRRTQDTLDIAVQAIKQTPTDSKRKLGAPVKNRDSEWMLSAFDSIQEKYKTAFPGKGKVGVKKVLTWYFETEFKSRNLRPTRAHGLTLQRRLTTFGNRLSEVRNPTVKKKSH